MLTVALLVTLAQAAAPAAAPPTEKAAPPAGPRVVLEVVQGGKALGSITVELDAAKAPITVANFLKYVRSGHYDGTIFHRVIPGFMIQGGGMTSDLKEKPTQAPIVNEAKNGLRNARGTIAMARTQDPNSATAQFFINVRDNYNLDYGMRGAGYAAFGRVVEGMAVADRIVATPTTSRGDHENIPMFAVLIKSARETKAVPAPAAAAPQPAAKP